MDFGKRVDQVGISFFDRQLFFESLYDKYAKYYNENHIRALSDFQNILLCTENHYEAKLDSLYRRIQTVFRIYSIADDKLSHLKDTYPNLSEYAKEKLELINSQEVTKNFFEEFIERTLDKLKNCCLLVLESKGKKDLREDLKQLVNYFENNLKPYCNLLGLEYSEYPVFEAYNTIEELEKSLLNSLVVGILIERIVSIGYPDKIDLWNENTNDEKQRIKNKLTSSIGRNYDPTAPQKPIKKKVIELANKKRFQKEDGTPKPTPIRDEILYNYPELKGKLKARALFNRVKRALDK